MSNKSNEFTQKLFSRLEEAGKDYSLRECGILFGATADFLKGRSLSESRVGLESALDAETAEIWENAIQETWCVLGDHVS